MVFRPFDEPHSDHFSSVATSGFLIEMPRSWLRKLESRVGRLQEPQCFETFRPWSLMQQIYREYRLPDDLSGLAVEALVLEMVVETKRLTAVPRVDKPKLRTVEKILADQFTSPLKLAQLAAAADLHPTHLARAFREHFHCTIGNYIRRRRVQFGWQRLTTTNRAIADIAVESGFASQAHFSTVFKRLTGFTPAQVRNQHKELAKHTR